MNLFPKKLYPNLVLNSVKDLNFEELKKRGIKGVIADLDNTLASWKNPNFNEDAKKLIEILNKTGFKLCILTNNTSSRALKFSKQINNLIIPNASKPSKKGFLYALDYMNLESHETAILGDQLFSDILGGNRTGLFTILVNPISKKDFFITRFFRQLEKIVFMQIRNEIRKGNIQVIVKKNSCLLIRLK